MATYKVLKEVVIDGVNREVNTTVSLDESKANPLVAEGKLEVVK